MRKEITTTVADVIIIFISILMIALFISELYVFPNIIFSNYYTPYTSIQTYTNNLSPTVAANSALLGFDWFMLTSSFWRIIYIFPPVFIVFYSKLELAVESYAVAFAVYFFVYLIFGIFEFFKNGYFIWVFLNCTNYFFCPSYDPAITFGSQSSLSFVLLWIFAAVWFFVVIIFVLLGCTLRNAASVKIYYKLASQYTYPNQNLINPNLQVQYQKVKEDTPQIKTNQNIIIGEIDDSFY